MAKGLVNVSGGGSSGGTIYANYLDTPPTTPHAKDDEFTDTTLNGKWAWLNQGGASYSLTSVPGYLLLSKPSEAINVRALVQDRPSGDFTVMAKVAYQASVDETYGGIILINSTTGNHYTIGVRNYLMGQTGYTDFTGGGAHDYATYGAIANFVWVKVVVTGTSMSIYYSSNGLFFPLTAQKTVAVPTSFDKIGIGAQIGVANRAISICADWFRVTE